MDKAENIRNLLLDEIERRIKRPNGLSCGELEELASAFAEVTKTDWAKTMLASNEKFMSDSVYNGNVNEAST